MASKIGGLFGSVASMMEESDAMEVQEQASEQAKEIANIASKSIADPDAAHMRELKRSVSRMDEAERMAALKILVIADPYSYVEILKDYISNLNTDLGNIKETLANRKAAITELFGGED